MFWIRAYHTRPRILSENADNPEKNLAKKTRPYMEADAYYH